MVGQEVGIYGVFIWMNDEPCITWPSSLDIGLLNTLGHFNFVLLLFLHKTIPLRDWSLITRRGGGLQNGKIAGRNFCAPPPSRQGKTFRPPPFKEWKLFATPLKYGLNFKLLRKNYPKTFCAPPSAWLKLFPSPPLFVGVKLHVPPFPSRFVARPPRN